MLDWEFTDETEEWPADTERLDTEPAPQWKPTRRFWLLLAGACIVLLVAGAGTLAWRIYERRQTMREDLTRVIYEEDRARFAGLAEEADTFVAADVPAAWKERYLRTFVPRSPNSIDIETMSFEDESALVTVKLDSDTQVRFYRLTEQNWQRAPVSVEQWGPEEQTLDSAGIALSYRQRDSEFARSLADRLPALLDAVTDWRYRPSTERIRITPLDLHTPIINASNEVIEVNSPQLVPFNSVISGDATVRLSLAETLIRQTSAVMPQGLRTQDSLPSGGRFLHAARTVTAMHAALRDEEQAQMVRVWRGALDNTWISPFYTPLTENMDPLAPAPADAAMLLTVNYIYRVYGAEALRDIVQRPAAINSWDKVFERAVGTTTLDLEHAVAASAAVDNVPPRTLATRIRFATTMTLLDANYSLRRRLYVQPEQTDAQLIADVAPTHARVAPGGLRLELGCIGPGSTVKLDGEWLEAGRRLRAAEITVERLALPDIFTLHDPPTDTIAYLLDTNQSLRIVALRPDGTRTPVLELRDDVRVVEAITPLYTNGGHTVQFMIDLRTSACNRQLTYVYAPGAGITHAWIMHQTVREPIWRPDTEDFLIVRGVSARIGHYGVFNVSPDDDVIQLNSFLRPRAWSPATQRLLVEDVRGRQGERNAFSLIDPATGDTRRLNLAGWQRSITDHHLTRDGRWLAYLTDQPGGSPVPDKLQLRQLDYYLNTIPIGLRAGEGLRLKTQRYAPNNKIVLWAGPVRAGQLMPNRLLVIDTEDLTDPIAVDERLNGVLTASIICPDGRILYRLTDDSGAVLLQKQNPDTQAQPLLNEATNLEPLACPPIQSEG